MSGRVLAMDVGERRIGLAVSDELGMAAHGIQTLQRQGLRLDMGNIRKVLSEYEIAKIVVGMPYNMNGTLGPRGEETLKFIKDLEKNIPEGVSVLPWDERLTTHAAQRVLLEADMSRAKRKKKVDQLAAVLILQGYLDSQSCQEIPQPVKD